MWHDNETCVDFLGFRRFAETVCSLCQTETLLPMTLGIFGDWGSGKSSVLGMIEQKLYDQKGVLCLRFDGWLFEGYDDAKAALMSEIIDALVRKSSDDKELGQKVREKAQNLLKRVDWFRLAGLATKGVLSLAVPPTIVGTMLGMAREISEGKGILKKGEEEKGVYENIRAFRSEFAELVEQAGVNPLVILIDDLDRCLPESIISTLEAVKLFLSVKGTAFILGADERIIRHAISSRYPEEKYGERKLGQDYLEKLIQIPVTLPTLSEHDVACYMYLLFAEKALGAEQSAEFEALCKTAQKNREKRNIAEVMNYGIAQTAIKEAAERLQKDFSLTERLAPVLAKGLNGNPRLIKRFLNALSLRMTMARGMKIDLQEEVLAKLMVLERFHEDRFRELFSWQAQQSGVACQIKNLEKAMRGEKDITLSDEEKVWLLEDDLKKWLGSNPSLAEVALGEYFYVSRETIRISTEGVRRLPPALQQIVADLRNKTKAIRRAAAKRLAELTPDEAAPVYDALIPQAATAGGEEALAGLLEAANLREDLAGRLVQDLQKVDPASLTAPSVFAIGKLREIHSAKKAEINGLLNTLRSCKGSVGKAAEAALKPSAVAKRTSGLQKGKYAKG